MAPKTTRVSSLASSVRRFRRRFRVVFMRVRTRERSLRLVGAELPPVGHAVPAGERLQGQGRPRAEGPAARGLWLRHQASLRHEPEDHLRARARSTLRQPQHLPGAVLCRDSRRQVVPSQVIRGVLLGRTRVAREKSGGELNSSVVKELIKGFFRGELNSWVVKGLIQGRVEFLGGERAY
eukprot:1189994-Prorocentrum_minimum.AAC.1